ncbi:TIGR03364 family FAD-dependent oxidoreductase [Stackebrandtia nassauensis]|uniref:FAD dependent oxidoreductase TIGR03364 n=1 Tax=Stackebrandtia nassauensis (strain DSM 44728 / CIP 108903 / NRRL B-16338 / NBRC 102104 / LLR-40K-21) TaxID=446470 RepID=D3PX42_STANL|nr:TIGR03364 family FAD-dependent oxidoreductase [Stackebrandtia nassauensis]ADD45266.1 FAD dependent oxidoreductase TIGR03364 [Stackebrandtia nassauensis DSM 44728]
MRIVVVGGGVLGTMHAWTAVAAGHEVVHIEREPEGRGASVRNFGLVWVSGRSAGVDLETALRGRELWQSIGDQVPGVGFRGIGSLTICRTPAEVAVAQAVLNDTRRGFSLLEPEEARALNPVLRGDFMAALHCEHDAAVESRVALPALRAKLAESGRYRFVGGREVRTVAAGLARDDHGEIHNADQIVVTPGAAHAGLVRELAGPTPPIRRVRLQMMQTAPLAERVTTAIADGDSFRYYPAFASEALDRLRGVQKQTPTAAAERMQLLLVQRLDGSLTIGDTHEYTEPFAFDVTEDAYEHLRDVATALLGRELPPIRRRWAGVYSQCLDPEATVFRASPEAGVHLVTGPGGRGMTCSPAIAQDTAAELGW